MKTRFHVAVTSRGAARLTKGRPKMRAGEVAIEVNVEIPDAAFRSPLVQAHILAGEGVVIKPEAEVWLTPQPEDEEQPDFVPESELEPESEYPQISEGDYLEGHPDYDSIKQG